MVSHLLEPNKDGLMQHAALANAEAFVVSADCKTGVISY